MPTTRNPGSAAGKMQSSFSLYLRNFGQSLTLVTATETRDSYNRVTAISEVSTSIMGDLQWVTKTDIDNDHSGQMMFGDGMLFVPFNTAIEIADGTRYEISKDSVRWLIISEIEAEEVQGQKTYRGFLVRRL